MSTSHDHREPLDTEERDLAARLARIGPFDGPSPALDAKILAAAHAAAATRKPNRRRHWAAWLGVPPALITGVGVAAAAVLALGLVWQLRPSTSVLVAQDETAGSSGEEIFVVATPAQSTRAPITNPPPFPHDSAAPAAQAAAKASAPMAITPSTESQARANAAAPAAAEARMEAAPAPPAPAAQAPAATAMQRDEAAADGFVVEPPAAASPAGIARKHATYTTSARATAERERAPMPAAAPAPSPASPAAESESKTLDRVEVTGSRVRRDAMGARPLAEVVVAEDTHLAAAEWLERIRARRDEGNLDGARQSLRLFRRDYPRIRIPDDLIPLLDRKQ